jgi:hypothetical protein
MFKNPSMQACKFNLATMLMLQFQLCMFVTQGVLVMLPANVYLSIVFFIFVIVELFYISHYKNVSLLSHVYTVTPINRRKLVCGL